MTDDVCQFLSSPLCCGVLCAQVTVCVQVQNHNAVAVQVVVCQQFLVQEQVAVRHMDVIFRHVGQLFLHIAHRVIAEISDETAGEIRRTLQHRRMISRHAFFQKCNGMCYLKGLALLAAADFSGVSGDPDFFLRRKANERVAVPLHAVADTFQDKRIAALLGKCPVDVQRRLVVCRELIEYRNGVVLFRQRFYLFQ